MPGSGRGWSNRPAQRLFQPFARAGTAGDVGGIGLGLYLARELVERHDGAIALCSMPGQGTTVRVSLPLAAPGRDGKTAA